MRAAPVTLVLRALQASESSSAPSVVCIRHLSSAAGMVHRPAAQPHTAPSPPTEPAPLIQPFHPSHLDSPTWSTRSYLPSPSSPPPQLPVGLVQRLASLAYLKLSADSLPELERDIAAMIGHISYIRHVQTTHPPIHSPLQLMQVQSDTEAEEAGPVEVSGERVGVLLRTSADVVSDGGNAEAVLRNARYTNRGFYVVPKVVDLDV